jgi:hypothetical protein
MRLRIWGVCAVAAIGVLLSAVSVASAAPPEFGHCVRAAAPKTGKFKAKCTIPASNGEWEWVPEPTGNTKYEDLGEQVAFETPAKLKITCAASTASGEITGPKTVTQKGNFIGCIDTTAQRCQTTPAKEGEIEYEAEGEIGFISNVEKPIVGLDLKAKSPSPTFATFVCGIPPETNLITGTIEGSVISAIKPVNRMTIEEKLPYKQSAGKQVPEQFEGGAKDTLTAKLLEGLELKEEPIGLRQNVIQESEEPIEIKAR